MCFYLLDHDDPHSRVGSRQNCNCNNGIKFEVVWSIYGGFCFNIYGSKGSYVIHDP